MADPVPETPLDAERGDPAGAPTPDWYPVFEAGCVRWRRTGSTLEVCRLIRGWFWSFPGEERGPFDLAWTTMLDANDRHPPSNQSGS